MHKKEESRTNMHSSTTVTQVGSSSQVSPASLLGCNDRTFTFEVDTEDDSSVGCSGPSLSLPPSPFGIRGPIISGEEEERQESYACCYSSTSSMCSTGSRTSTRSGGGRMKRIVHRVASAVSSASLSPKKTSSSSPSPIGYGHYEDDCEQSQQVRLQPRLHSSPPPQSQSHYSGFGGPIRRYVLRHVGSSENLRDTKNLQMRLDSPFQCKVENEKEIDNENDCRLHETQPEPVSVRAPALAPAPAPAPSFSSHSPLRLLRGGGGGGGGGHHQKILRTPVKNVLRSHPNNDVSASQRRRRARWQQQQNFEEQLEEEDEVEVQVFATTFTPVRRVVRTGSKELQNFVKAIRKHPSTQATRAAIAAAAATTIQRRWRGYDARQLCMYRRINIKLASTATKIQTRWRIVLSKYQLESKKILRQYGPRAVTSVTLLQTLVRTYLRKLRHKLHLLQNEYDSIQSKKDQQLRQITAHVTTTKHEIYREQEENLLLTNTLQECQHVITTIKTNNSTVLQQIHQYQLDTKLLTDSIAQQFDKQLSNQFIHKYKQTELQNTKREYDRLLEIQDEYKNKVIHIQQQIERLITDRDKIVVENLIMKERINQIIGFYRHRQHQQQEDVTNPEFLVGYLE